METTDYVSYPIALALKKAGFDWPCRDFYWTSDGVFKHTDALVHKNSEHCTTMVAAPTSAVAQKWLRKVKKTAVYVIPVPKTDRLGSRAIVDTHTWKAVIGTKYGLKHPCFNSFDNYEQALSDGINTALFIINEKL